MGYAESTFYPPYLVQFLQPNIYLKSTWGKNKLINLVTSWEECQVPRKDNWIGEESLGGSWGRPLEVSKFNIFIIFKMYIKIHF